MKHVIILSSLVFFLAVPGVCLFTGCRNEADLPGTSSEGTAAGDTAGIEAGAPAAGIIVRFEDGVSQEDMQSFIAASGLCVKKRFRSRKFDLSRLVVLELGLEDSLESLVRDLNNSELVKYAEPDYKGSLHATPNDPDFSNCWGLHNTGQTGGTADCDIDAPEAWDMTTGSDSIVVGVIDSGIDYNHPDLAANVWTNPGEIAGNGTDDDGNGYIDDIHGWDFAYDDGDPMDGYGHGTHCSGIIAAVGNDGSGICGVCWKAKIMAVKWFDDDGFGDSSDAIASIYYALDMNARILSNSWSVFDSWALMDAVLAAQTDGVLFVAASGNTAQDCDVSGFYPACYDYANIISVAASNANDQLWSQSNWGAVSVDLAAPGQDIYSTMPISLGSYSTESGTSMATPCVAGVAALLLSTDPGLTVAQVKSYILDNVDPVSAFDGKLVTGGRLNAYGAVAVAFLPSITINSVSHSVVGPTQDSNINWVTNCSGTYCVEVGGTGEIGTGTEIDSGACTASVPVDTAVLAADIPDGTLATVWVMVDDAGAVGSNSTQIRDDHAEPSSVVAQPGNGASLDSVDTVEGTASDAGGSTVGQVEVSLFDGAKYYDAGSGEFTSATEVWLAASGLTSWSLDTSAVPWEHDEDYTVRTRASDAVGNVETPGAGNTFTFTGNPPAVVAPPRKKSKGCALTGESSPESVLGWALPLLLLLALLLVLRQYRLHQSAR